MLPGFRADHRDAALGWERIPDTPEHSKVGSRPWVNPGQVFLGAVRRKFQPGKHSQLPPKETPPAKAHPSPSPKGNPAARDHPCPPKSCWKPSPAPEPLPAPPALPPFAGKFYGRSLFVINHLGLIAAAPAQPGFDSSWLLPSGWRSPDWEQPWAGLGCWIRIPMEIPGPAARLGLENEILVQALRV